MQPLTHPDPPPTPLFSLAQAVMGSKPAVKLRNEVDAFNADPIEGIRLRVMKKPLKPPTAECIIDGPRYTPYEGFYLILKLAVPDDYPFSPPRLR